MKRYIRLYESTNRKTGDVNGVDYTRGIPTEIYDEYYSIMLQEYTEADYYKDTKDNNWNIADNLEENMSYTYSDAEDNLVDYIQDGQQERDGDVLWDVFVEIRDKFTEGWATYDEVDKEFDELREWQKDARDKAHKEIKKTIKLFRKGYKLKLESGEEVKVTLLKHQKSQISMSTYLTIGAVDKDKTTRASLIVRLSDHASRPQGHFNAPDIEFLFLDEDNINYDIELTDKFQSITGLDSSRMTSYSDILSEIDAYTDDNVLVDSIGNDTRDLIKRVNILLEEEINE